MSDQEQFELFDIKDLTIPRIIDWVLLISIILILLYIYSQKMYCNTVITTSEALAQGMIKGG